jgi:F0F1-type ATP synthase assembly protein I
MQTHRLHLNDLENTMDPRNGDKTSWAVGGGLLAGTGIGFFFLETSALAFIGSMLAGLGLGLLVAAIISRRKDASR